MVEHPKTRVLMACGAAAWLSVGASRASAQSFQLLGLPSGTAGSYGQSISYDGGVVVGASFFGGSGNYGPGWSWTQPGGRVSIAGPGLSPNSNAYGVSGSGRFAVGETGASLFGSPAIAYRYDRTTGEVVSLGVQSEFTRSRALGASFDGSAVVGYSALDQSLGTTQAFRWTQSGGLQGLGYTRVGQHNHSEATGVSADGQTVVGWSQGLTSQDAFVWTSTTGMVTLAGVPGTDINQALGVSANANIIVGWSGNHAAMWSGGVYSDLGTAPGYAGSIARGVSDDGLIAVGQVMNGAPSSYTAAIWRSGNGWQPLEPYLLSIGVTVPDGINLNDATGISRDGRTITGYTTVSGGTQQAWVATIPSPSVLCILCAFGLYTSRRARRPLPL